MNGSWSSILCRHRRIVGTLLPILWTGVCLAQTPTAAPQPAAALIGSVFTQTARGYRTTVDCRWIEGSGYWPIRIRVAPLAVATADQELDLRIVAHGYWGPNEEGILLEQTIAIPAGTPAGQGVEMALSLPPTSNTSDYSIAIDDPATLKPIFKQPSIKFTGNANNSYLADAFSQFPRVLFVGSSLPNTAAMMELMPGNSTYQQQLQNTGTVYLGNQTPATPPTALPLPTTIAVPPAGLPERWIDYTSLDVIVLTLNQLVDLSEKRPAAFRGVMQWVAAGGNLWVCGLSGDKGRWQRIPELEKLLGLRQDERRTPDATIPKGWTQPVPGLFGQHSATNLASPPYPSPMPVASSGNSNGGKQGEEKPPSAPGKPGFLLREFGLGQIAAIAAADPCSSETKWSKWDWDWLLTTMGDARWQWTKRHGLAVGQANRDFWNFLIPGVGLAPVRTFQILITLFVLGIGPANYWLLRRAKRLHLMVLTVPLSAAVVTAALFAYALLADGLSVRLRVRSFTRLDQRRGTAATWARLSYYAGMAPSGGLKFSAGHGRLSALEHGRIHVSGRGAKKDALRRRPALDPRLARLANPDAVRDGPLAP